LQNEGKTQSFFQYSSTPLLQQDAELQTMSCSPASGGRGQAPITRINGRPSEIGSPKLHGAGKKAQKGAKIKKKGMAAPVKYGAPLLNSLRCY